MIDNLLNLIAPHICCSCGRENGVLCENCFFDIVDMPYERCIVCTHPVIKSNLCTLCEHHAPYDDAWVVGERCGGLLELVDQYKFERSYAAAPVLARLLATSLPLLPDDLTVAYIPNIASHRRQRGYDHMKRIAVELGKQRQWRVEDMLTRQTSLSQRGVGRAERLRRQRGAFRVEYPVTTPVLLIDDVYTTGATLAAGVAAIRAVSNQPVYVAIIARQPKDAKVR